ncbi:1273_t:CDS:10, partial [Funneliformis geosporum]
MTYELTTIDDTFAKGICLHTATLIDDKLYILGGGNEAIPAHVAAAGGANNKTLFLYGGIPYNDEAMSLVYAFDTRSNSWAPEISSVSIIRKYNLKGIVGYYGKMYLFGGESNKIPVNDMLILDIINLNWEIGSSINAPSPRSVYGATLFSDHFIIYMGGFNGFAISLKELTSGIIPSDRNSFSVVLGIDGQIIIFGGANNLVNLQPQNSLYVLNLINYEWYIPKISGKVPAPRRWHEAIVIGKYMVVSFGLYDDNDILLLDISNNEEYIWTNDFTLPTNLSTKLSILAIIFGRVTKTLIMKLLENKFYNGVSVPLILKMSRDSNNYTLFLYVGNYDGIDMKLFYAFDTWSVPKIANGIMSREHLIQRYNKFELNWKAKLMPTQRCFYDATFIPSYFIIIL